MQIFRHLLLLLAAAPLCVHAQPGDSAAVHARDPFSLSARMHYGFIIPHSREIIDVSRSNPYGIELDAQWLLAREKYTRNSGVVARRGIVLHYFNFDNPRVLGHCVAVTPYIEPLIRPWGRLHGSIQLGLGLAWLNRVYHPESNPANLFFSFPVSMLAMTNAYLSYRINPYWEASLGLNYNHISNGGMKNPNKGMNFPTYNAGMAWHFDPTPVARPPKNADWKNGPRNYAYFLLAGSIKTAEATAAFPENKPRWLLGGMVAAGRRIGRLSALSAGTEWIHDGHAREILDRENMRTSAWKGGVMFGHELLTGRMRFTVHLGAYVYNPSRNTDAVYQRYGLWYRFGERVLFGSTLKAHRHVADVFDIRLGWIMHAGK